MNTLQKKQLMKAASKFEKQITWKNLWLCKLGLHKDRIIAESGYLMSFTIYVLCLRCGTIFQDSPSDLYD